jgi:cytochrome c oxidase assembly protein subunit 15
MTGPLHWLAKICLILVIVLVTLSSYLRLDHSGIGCQPWPACYGNIGIAGDTPDIANTYERLLEEARAPLSWAAPTHRLVASVLGILILVLNMFAWQQKSQRLISFALLLLTVFLAWLGIYSEGLHSPAVVMGNLVGGFTMLGLLGWMVMRKPAGEPKARNTTHRLTQLALIALCVQIVLGGLTSANFAASACQTLPDCQGSWLPGAELMTAFDLSRTHDVSSNGMVLGGPERAAIHQLHRLVAVVAALIVLAAGAAAFRAGGVLRIAGIASIMLVSAEVSLGVTAVLGTLPIAVAVAHNWLAALLLLALLALFAESRAKNA